MSTDTIEVSNLTKSFGDSGQKIEVLRQLSFVIKKSQTVAILGRSGSGKSTLLSLLAGLDVPDDGKIKVAGEEISNLSQKKLTDFRANHIGIIFQNFHLLEHLTALENVALSYEITHRDQGGAYAREQARETLKKVGLEHRQGHFPSMLSGGEKQRVAIARALVVNPTILLADEPSGSLDEKTGIEVMSLIFQLAHDFKRTLVVVTHDKKIAGQCQLVLELDQGRLVTCS